MIAAVTALGIVAVSTEEPITYMVFPALIWAAFRFWASGRNALDRDHRGRGDRRDSQRRRPVLPAGDRPQDAQRSSISPSLR